MEVKRIDITKIGLACALVAVSSLSHAQSTSVQKLNTKKAGEDSIKWSSEFVTTYSSNLYKVGATESSSGADFDATLAATYAGTKFYVNTSVTKALTGQRDLSMNNVYLGAARTLYKFDEQWTLSGGMKVTIPTSEASKDYQRQITGVNVAPKISWKNGGLNLSYAPSATVNFHEYETSLTGASNYQYVLSNSLSAVYQFESGLYLYGQALYSRLFTYERNTKDSYRFMQMVGYPVGQFDLALGHMLGGSPLATNGIETEVRFFDSRDSTVFGMLTVSF